MKAFWPFFQYIPGHLGGGPHTICHEKKFFICNEKKFFQANQKDGPKNRVFGLWAWTPIFYIYTV